MLFSPKNRFQFHPAKFENLKTIQIKKVSQLHKDKVCWSETIFSFWSSNVFPIQI